MMRARRKSDCTASGPSLLLRGSLWVLWALSLWWFDRNLPLILGLGLLAWVVETLVNTFLIPMEALLPRS